MRRGFVAQRLHDITAPEKCQLVEKQASYEIVRPYRYVRGSRVNIAMTMEFRLKLMNVVSLNGRNMER